MSTRVAAVAAKSLQLRLTLCDPISGSTPGSPVPGILQARTLEWSFMHFSNAWKWKVKAKSLSRVRLLGTLWTIAHQAPPSMGFSRQEYWSGVPLPSALLPYSFIKVLISCGEVQTLLHSFSELSWLLLFSTKILGFMKILCKTLLRFWLELR